MKASHNSINRRQFLGQASCAAVGTTSLLSTLTNMLLTNSAVAQNAAGFTDYRAMICLFLPGGNDSFNLLVPTGAAYSEYAQVRADLALPQASLLPISPLNTASRPLALHPGATGLQTLFTQQKLAFLANVGSLVRPTTLGDFNTGNSLPYGIFSHSDQQEQWQSSIPDVRSGVGWAGRAADLLESANISSNVSMNISISGNNLFQVGNQIVPYTVNASGASALNGYAGTGGYDPIRHSAIDNQLAQEYKNMLDKTYARMKRNSLDAYQQFTEATANPLPADNLGNGPLGSQLRQVAKIIAGRNTLGVKRQIFYVQWGGWDFHDNVVDNMAAMIPVVSDAVKAFYDLTVAMGVQNNVTLFSASEFGRSLTSNAKGSDHAWGGNQFMVGGAVNGQKIYGTYPDLFQNNSLDTGRGRLIPTTSVDQMAAELAIWMGVSKSDLPLVLPNISRFYNISGSANPLGFMA
ncbi:DUF1501 domain-containing protein [Fibrella aquatilis]|uniref:DUF1501 domain-containing protein n=1 Tax=Fibrella aquatilis TaxID=2817059 RepID=A0A939G7X9_9BACT|nr:DUF1501 domain-containing protein [Fibrella aquatilis]MBO0933859.1 DUF1501 domain-containing protein [Fibrella aquatilis]